MNVAAGAIVIRGGTLCPRRVSAFRRAASRQSDRGPRPGSDPDADEMNLLAASGALCWAAGMATPTGRGGREAGVTETDGLSDVGRLVVFAVEARTDEIGAVVRSN
jgi:hypothetical protein